MRYSLTCPVGIFGSSKSHTTGFQVLSWWRLCALTGHSTLYTKWAVDFNLRTTALKHVTALVRQGWSMVLKSGWVSTTFPTIGSIIQTRFWINLKSYKCLRMTMIVQTYCEMEDPDQYPTNGQWHHHCCSLELFSCIEEESVNTSTYGQNTNNDDSQNVGLPQKLIKSWYQ